MNGISRDPSRLLIAALTAIGAEDGGQRCELCRSFIDGDCDGLPGGGPAPSCFERAIDQHGDIDPETGDWDREKPLNGRAAPHTPGASAEPPAEGVPPGAPAAAGRLFVGEMLDWIRRRYSPVERAMAAALRGGAIACLVAAPAVLGVIHTEASRPGTGPAAVLPNLPPARPAGYLSPNGEKFSFFQAAVARGPERCAHAAAPSSAAGRNRSEASGPQSRRQAGRAAGFLSRSLALGRFLDAVEAVESGGDAQAVGDGGRSLGPYQISAGYWADGGGDPAVYLREVWHRQPCRAVIVEYFRRYCPAALARGDWRRLAAVHNGGPDGGSKPAAGRYAARVAERMQRIQAKGLQHVERPDSPVDCRGV
jgi:hypothetical protein